ncbi:hypothetical protein DFH07DRAFT_768772 [Mycena maculata]|uniref:Uncharacterized protein n=1 Tax=Mycena maculata TaxID=230809 RepID=A0AAD7JVD5_9AGAR|nr:hypothetical protein DFH07DRAFT_768772 [Mycena maculata]
MPAGRLQLKPEVKLQHTQDSRKRPKFRETQRGRTLTNATPCSKRAAIVASDFHTRRRYREKAALDSEMYRVKRDAELAQSRVAAAVKQTKRDVEHVALRNRHLVVGQKAPSPAEHAPAAGKKHCPHPPRLPSPTMPTPVPSRLSDIPSLNHISDTSDEEPEERPPVWPASPEWIEHEGNHFFPTCKYCKGADCPECACHKGPLVHPGPFYAIYCQEWAGCITSSASRDRLLCQYPRASTFEAPTWAEFLRRWCLKCEEYHWHPEQNKWSPLVPLSWESSPPSSPSTLTASAPSHTPSPPALAEYAQIAAEAAVLLKWGPLATPRAPSSPTKLSLRECQAQRNAKYGAYLKAEEARLEVEAAAKKKEELAFLASTRGSVSPERMCQQFVRVLGPASALEWPPPLSKSSPVLPKEGTNAQVHNGEREHALFNPHGQTQACQQCLAMAAALPTKHHGEGVEQFWDKAPVMYAVSGQNRVFKDRERAMAAFKEMPGAELVFTRNEDELFGFLEDFEKKFKI